MERRAINTWGEDLHLTYLTSLCFESRIGKVCHGKLSTAVQFFKCLTYPTYIELASTYSATHVFIKRLTSLYQAITNPQMSYPQLTEIWKKANRKVSEAEK